MSSNNPDQNELRPRNEIFTDDTVQLLSTGFLNNCKPPLENVKQQLTELTDKQVALIERMHEQNLELSATLHSSELHNIFNSIRIYKNKLVSIRKDMRSLHERSTKLKKRALRLQQYSEKESYMKQQEKENRIKLEEELISKPSTSSTN